MADLCTVLVWRLFSEEKGYEGRTDKWRMWEEEENRSPCHEYRGCNIPSSMNESHIGIAVMHFEASYLFASGYGILMQQILVNFLSFPNIAPFSASFSSENNIWRNIQEIRNGDHLANIKPSSATIEQSSWPVIYLAFAYKVKEKQALQGFKPMDVHEKQAECMLHLGDLAHAHGNTVAAITHWKTACLLFGKSSQMKDIAQIDSNLAAIEKADEQALITLAYLEAPHQQLHVFPSSKEESPNAVLV
ncbi:hypothetical protein C8R45DRAFT_948174 [Mycena sanguinolenta]|nr:hypothetical protein C8R45DRAFT_948174 [Mycena sanguinolenta]